MLKGAEVYGVKLALEFPLKDSWMRSVTLLLWSCAQRLWCRVGLASDTDDRDGETITAAASCGP